MLTSYDLFKNLRGVWNFSRTVNNIFEPGASGTVTGQANFKEIPTQQNLRHYSEIGKFATHGGLLLDISKEYIFEYNTETDRIEKYFAQDGRKSGLFYVLGDDLTAEHLCIQDVYKASYKCTDDSFREFTLTYEVTGPKKKYTSTTRYYL